MTPQRNCNGCEGSLRPWLFMPIDAKKNTKTNYPAVLQCAVCKLGVLDPLPKKGAIQQFYELNSYYTHGEGHITPLRETFADRILNRIAWGMDYGRSFEPRMIAPKLPIGGSVCDLGCGNAKYLQQFRDLGFETIGIDPDQTAREQARSAGVTVLPGTSEDLPAEMLNKKFDLVIMTHSLEHCLDPMRALVNAYKLTKPGGLCYIEVPNCQSRHFQTFSICSEMFDAPRHIYFFEPNTLSAMMTKLSFIPLESLFNGYCRNFNQSWRGWELTIADRIKKNSPALKPKKHSFACSVLLLFNSFWRQPQKKYDSFGLLMKRPGRA